MINQEKHVLVTSEGEFLKEVKFDGVAYWDYDYNGFPALKRMKNILQSDSMFRDFICVDDVVNIVLHNIKSSGIYDLGTSDPVTFSYVADCVVEKYGGEIEIIPFPNNLIGKYQNFTCAQKVWDNYKFKTIKEFLS